MSKVLIRNQFGTDQRGTFSLPCGVDDATAFCNAVLDGSYQGFLSVEKSGNEKVSNYSVVVVTGKQSDNGQKATIRFNAAASKNENEIITALKGHTFDNVKFDEVYVISLMPVVGA